MLDMDEHFTDFIVRDAPLPRDGNSMFSALHDQLEIVARNTETPDCMRSTLCRHIRTDPIVRQHVEQHLSVAGRHESLDEYLERMSRDGESGDECFLFAASHYYNCTIKVHLPGDNSARPKTVEYSGGREAAAAAGGEFVIHLGHRTACISSTNQDCCAVDANLTPPG